MNQLLEKPKHLRAAICAIQLEQVITDAQAWLLEMGEANASRKPEAHVWSAKEILGHLIDAASHAHQRFVRAALEDGARLSSYQQDEWVKLAAYQQREWHDLIALWTASHDHLRQIVSRLNDAQLEHHLFVGSRQITLHELVEAYVRHLEHHLEQIRERSTPEANHA
jgi:DinB superfamily